MSAHGISACQAVWPGGEAQENAGVADLHMIPVAQFHRRSLFAEHTAQQPGPRRGQYTAQGRNAAPVCCSGWFGVLPTSAATGGFEPIAGCGE